MATMDSGLACLVSNPVAEVGFLASGCWTALVVPEVSPAGVGVDDVFGG